MQKKRKHNNGIIAAILKYSLFLAFVTLCGLIFFDCYSTWSVNQTTEKLLIMRKIEKRNNLTDWSAGMLSVNEDYVGWLNVIGTEVNGPVVQGDSNEEYLRKNFYGNHSEAGTFFIDENVNLNNDSENIIIYGHLMNDDTMFGTLKQFKDKDFFMQNGLVRWECEAGIQYYKIFAGMIISGDNSKLQSWINNEFVTEAQMLKDIQEKAFVWQEDKFRTGPYLFLVTCDYQIKNGRLVLVAAQM